MKTRTAPALVLAAAALAASPTANAQCHIYRSDVPDFDQVRQGDLPGDGSMYCVPTSAVNWVAYCANNGLPFMMSGPRNWQSNANYDYVTSQIDLMGDFMQTSASGGTGGSNGEAGLENFLFARAPFFFNVIRQSGGVGPFTAFNHMLSGALVNICYGYYKQQPNVIGGGFSYIRDGGHCVTLTGILDGCAATSTFRMRNPASAGDSTFSQSTFTSLISGVRFETFRNNTVFPVNISRARMLDLGVDSTTRRYMDSIYAIYPQVSLTASATLGRFDQIVVNPALAGVFGGFNKSVATPNGQPISEIAFSHDMAKVFYITEPPAATTGARPLIEYALADGSVRPLMTLPGGSPLAVDRFGALYLVVGGEIRKYDVSGRAPEMLGGATPPDPVRALFYDDGRDELVGIAPSTRRLLRYPPGLDGVVNEPLPTPVMLVGDPHVAVDPATGRFFVASDGSPTIYELSLIPGSPRLQVSQTLTPQGLTGVDAIQFTDGGVLVALGDGSVREFERGPTTGLLLPAVQPHFAHLGGRGASVLALSRSRSDFDRALEDSPAWRNVPESLTNTEIPDCPADLDWNGRAEVNDIFLFLAAWFDEAPNSDFDGNGRTEVADIFAYLSAWFAGCP